jgi:SAM-dependent methyltransferase
MAALAKLKEILPWWAKIAAKVVLARLPVGGRTWQSLGLFSPGEMDDPDYAIGIFARHYRAAGSPGPGFSFLELGPGDSLASAVTGRAFGAAGGWLVDAGAYAARDMGLYRRLAAQLAKHLPGADLSAVADAADTADMLERFSVRYLETGLAGLRMVPDASCDMIFSQAVLEHVPRDEFAATIAEFHRILKPGGVGTHQVDFRDHLGGGLNNLRFSEKLWEAPWFARRSGFYTNRLRLSEMIAMMRAAGFGVEIAEVSRWAEAPLARANITPALSGVGEEDLRVWEAFIVLGRAP